MAERSTKQKEFIKDYLENAYCHPTAFDALNAAKEAGIKIGLTSVYRILNSMVEKGEAVSLITKDNMVHYDTIRPNHYHFICNHCNKVFDIDYDLDIFEKIRQRYNLNCDNIQSISIYGTCDECLKK